MTEFIQLAVASGWWACSLALGRYCYRERASISREPVLDAFFVHAIVSGVVMYTAFESNQYSFPAVVLSAVVFWIGYISARKAEKKRACKPEEVRIK